MYNINSAMSLKSLLLRKNRASVSFLKKLLHQRYMSGYDKQHYNNNNFILILRKLHVNI